MTKIVVDKEKKEIIEKTNNIISIDGDQNKTEISSLTKTIENVEIDMTKTAILHLKDKEFPFTYGCFEYLDVDYGALLDKSYEIGSINELNALEDFILIWSDTQDARDTFRFNYLIDEDVYFWINNNTKLKDILLKARNGWPPDGKPPKEDIYYFRKQLLLYQIYNKFNADKSNIKQLVEKIDAFNDKYNLNPIRIDGDLGMAMLSLSEYETKPYNVKDDFSKILFPNKQNGGKKKPRGYASMTVKQLQEIAKSKKIPYSKLKKDELIKKLRGKR